MDRFAAGLTILRWQSRAEMLVRRLAKLVGKGDALLALSGGFAAIGARIAALRSRIFGARGRVRFCLRGVENLAWNRGLSRESKRANKLRFKF